MTVAANSRVVVQKVSDPGTDVLDFSAPVLGKIQQGLYQGLQAEGDFLASVRNCRVFIKPNLVRPDPKRVPAMATDGRVILALADLLLAHGAGEISVGDNPGFTLPFRRAIADAGIVAELEKRRVRLVAIDELPVRRVPIAQARLFRSYDQPVLDYDLFINLPKMKTHMHAIVSLGIKNLYGLVLDAQRLTFHRQDIHRKLVELLHVYQPDMNIVDGLVPMQGQAPLSGEPVFGFNTLVLGRDIVAVDATATRLMGIEPREVDSLRLAAKQGFGRLDSRNISVIGDCAAAKPFKRAVLSSAGAFDPVESIECGVCAGCLSGIRHSLDKLQFEGNLRRLKDRITLFSGRPMQNMATLPALSGPLILFGNCAFDLLHYAPAQRSRALLVPGCAPHVLDLYRLLHKEFLDG